MDTTLHEVLGEKGQDIYSVNADATVQDAVNVMVQNRVGCVLVMENDQVKGLFTERDLMTRVVHEGKDPKTTPIGDVMTTEIATVSPQMRIDEAMSLCTKKRLRHLPVYDDNKLVGIVSTGDLTKAAVGEQEHKIDDLTSYIYGA